MKDFTKQDSIILNIQRTGEVSLDLAMHLVSEKKLGLSKASREAFRLLQDNAPLAKSLMNMVEFRNIAIHDDQVIDLDIYKSSH